ncbi:MAG: hypothetical protein IPP88_24455 [Betaproteobacteria bacterium]|nr:hypothetical protein [Betaproteobacteria bacterium]
MRTLQLTLPEATRAGVHWLAQQQAEAKKNMSVGAVKVSFDLPPPARPAHLEKTYRWAYVSAKTVKIFERQWLVNARSCEESLPSVARRHAG